MSKVDMVRTKINGNWEIILPKYRAERPEYHSEEGWERKRLDALYNHIKPGDLVYYIGAEEGEHPALCQMWGAKVVMFEPNQKAWPNIRAIWNANNLELPEGIFVGFASNKTELKPKHLDYDDEVQADGWPKCAHDKMIGAHGFRQLYQETKAVKQMEIDVFAREHNHKPTLITFDVEGSEWQVLKGAERVIQKYKPVLIASIHPEFMFDQFNQYSHDFRNWIKGFGYKETLIDYQHEAHFLYEAI